jgi:alkylhydroperoxidase family enzyme
MTSSCPGLSRASTFLRPGKKDVDGRVKPGHDDGASNLAVIASAAKQSISRQNGCMDCFAALAKTRKFRSQASSVALLGAKASSHIHRSSFIISVDAMFTTFIERPFTNISHAIGKRRAIACV